MSEPSRMPRYDVRNDGGGAIKQAPAPAKYPSYGADPKGGEVLPRVRDQDRLAAC